MRPASYPALAEARRRSPGARIGIPRMYINADPEAGTAEHPGIGGPTGQRIETRASVIALWEAARRDLEAAGADVVEVDFPVVSNYEGDRPGAPTIATRGLVTPEFLTREIVDLSAWAWDDFLAANGDPALRTLADVDGARDLPAPGGRAPRPLRRLRGRHRRLPRLGARRIPARRSTTSRSSPTACAASRRPAGSTSRSGWTGSASTRWSSPPSPTSAPADMDVNPASADLGWRNGVWVANGNLVPRHLGIPTVTVPMGTMADIGMPVGLTFAGRAYDDAALLSLAAAFEATGAPPHRTAAHAAPPVAAPA